MNPPSICAPPRILVADDDEGIRLVISTVLRKDGFIVNLASDGELAWEALHHESYDLLVTDNKMPRLTGLELIRRMRRMGMAQPVVVASGSFLADGARPDPELHISAVLPKPFELSELRNAVRQALSTVAPSLVARSSTSHQHNWQNL